MDVSLLHHLGMSIAAATAGSAAAAAPAGPHPIIELRQYKLVAGAQDEFVKLFDSKFVESQEADGMRLIGQFTDHDRRDRFTWIRAFPDMDSRAKSLQAFYFGPVWAANKSTANPMLDDNDNVLLLRAAAPDSGFGSSAPRPSTGTGAPHRMIFAVIEYLWKGPDDGFSDFFLNDVRPLLAAAGLSVLGAYVPEEAPNNFPRLPVRPDRKLLVWFTAAPDSAAFDRIVAKLHHDSRWKQLADYEERPPQILRLDPTPRSALR
jgi:hypothetical protein